MTLSYFYRAASAATEDYGDTNTCCVIAWCVVFESDFIASDTFLRRFGRHFSVQYHFNPCDSWGDAGPIIQKNKISILEEGGYWAAYWDFYNEECGGTYFEDATYANNPLTAAMVTYLKMRAGDKVFKLDTEIKKLGGE